MKKIAAAFLTLAVATMPAMAQLNPPPAHPQGTYPADATTSTVTVGESTSTPETISSNPMMSIDEVVYAPGGTYFDEDGTTPAIIPAGYAPLDPATVCLMTDMENNETTFETLVEETIEETNDATTGAEVVLVLTTKLEDFEAWNYDASGDILQNGLTCSNHRPIYRQAIEIVNGYGVPSMDWFWLECRNCGHYTPPPSTANPPPYLGHEEYYEAMADFRTKTEAILHNVYLEVNQNAWSTDPNFALDILINYERRMQLAGADMIYDMYAAWWYYNN